MKEFIQLPKLQPGDQVGIISPSAGVPELFPWVQDLGLQRQYDKNRCHTATYLAELLTRMVYN